MIASRTVEANGISLYIQEAGQGPLVVLCHGFPETSHLTNFKTGSSKPLPLYLRLFQIRKSRYCCCDAPGWSCSAGWDFTR